MRAASHGRGGVLLVATLSLGCTEQSHVVAGPAVAYPAGKPTYGGVVALGKGTGSSEDGPPRFHTLGPAARLLVTPEVRHLRAGYALQLGEWVGPRKLLLEGTVPLALGAERFAGRFDGSVGSGLALRLGYPLTDQTTSLAPLFFPSHLVTNEQRRKRRERTVLFAGPSADIDFRFSRQPLPTLSFLIGVMWLSENLPAEQPLPASFTRSFPVR